MSAQEVGRTYDCAMWSCTGDAHIEGGLCAYHRGMPMPRDVRVAQILALRERGLTNPKIAAALGVTKSAVRNALSDPDGSKQRARRDSYGGVCMDCGARTQSDGTSRASERCPSCASSLSKTWTREAVVSAIQRFTARHGRPPTANEWINADPDNGYPSRGAVYRSSSQNSSAPFASWREAIETACPGIHAGSGRRTYKEVHTMPQARNGYVILRETDTGWEIVSESDEGTQVGALNDALNGSAPEGRWVAIPRTYWRPRELRPRTIYDWAEETAPA